MTQWPIDKQYPDPTPRHGITIRVRDSYDLCSSCGGRNGHHKLYCLWHDADHEARLPLYPPLPARPVGHWKIAVILSIGLLSAFGAGVLDPLIGIVRVNPSMRPPLWVMGLIALVVFLSAFSVVVAWTRYVVSCQ